MTLDEARKLRIGDLILLNIPKKGYKRLKNTFSAYPPNDKKVYRVTKHWRSKSPYDILDDTGRVVALMNKKGEYLGKAVPFKFLIKIDEKTAKVLYNEA